MSFFKTFFASCLGALVAMIIFGVLGIGFLISLGNDFNTETTEAVEDNSVLQLKLSLPISEMESDDSFAKIFPGSESNTGLIRLKATIKRAKNDSSIRGIYLDISSLAAGITTISEVRESIMDFRTSGKWVVAYSDGFSEGAYYLASAADKVYLNPEGELEFNGLAIEATFFKRMLDKLEIKPEVFKVGDFKSAVEPFVRENMSDPNRLQLNSMINSIYGQILTKISETRKISKERLKEISDKMLVRNAHQALEYGLVDSLYYEDQVKAEICSRLGIDKDRKITFVRYSNYKQSMPPAGKSSNEIAVIVAEGTILPGESGSSTVGGETIMDEVRRARINDKVKAIVLRVNSPGGSFQASDEMWREISLAAKEKTVIASMGDYAASGGYYISMACDTIVAHPTTITGSIGIFSVLWDLSGFLNNKIGITTEEVKTGEIGSLMTVTRPLTPVEQEIWQKKTEDIYEVFTGKAAQGRHMSKDEIKKIASGRVWTGEQAKENGLVDVLGDFNDAIAIAAKSAKLSEGDYRIRFYPKQKTFLEKFTGSMEKDARSAFIKTQLGDYYPWFQQWEYVKQYEGVQARMQWDLRGGF